MCGETLPGFKQRTIEHWNALCQGTRSALCPGYGTMSPMGAHTFVVFTLWRAQLWQMYCLQLTTSGRRVHWRCGAFRSITSIRNLWDFSMQQTVRYKEERKLWGLRHSAYTFGRLCNTRWQCAERLCQVSNKELLSIGTHSVKVLALHCVLAMVLCPRWGPTLLWCSLFSFCHTIQRSLND